MGGAAVGIVIVRPAMASAARGPPGLLGGRDSTALSAFVVGCGGGSDGNDSAGGGSNVADAGCIVRAGGADIRFA